VKEDPVAGTILVPRERVKALGYDPGHLTPAEQEELLELNASLGQPQQDPRSSDVSPT
jgi:hypothetical protein